MLTDRGRRVSICIGTLEYGHRKFRGGGANGCYGGGFVDRSSERCRDWSPPKSPASRILRISSPTTSPPSETSPVSLNCFNSNGAGGYIEHRVSKFDTLAGIAIKYGVEVADITKLNGLVTDLQMFALNSLRIPLPGRHPPSPCLSISSFSHGEECSEQASSASNGNLQDVFDPFQSLRPKPSETKISPAMDSLQGYYGLKKPRNKRASHPQDNNDHYLTPLPPTSTPLNQHRKSRSLVDAVIAEVNQTTSYGYNKEVMKPMRRRQKSEADFSWRTPPELVLKESRNSSSSSGGFSAIAGKGLALRPKASSRTNLSAAAT